MISYQIFTNCLAQIVLKIKNAQSLLKLGSIDISNMLISILMSIIIFIKYLPPVRPKFVPILKVPRINGNLEHFIFQISRSQFQC